MLRGVVKVLCSILPLDDEKALLGGCGLKIGPPGDAGARKWCPLSVVGSTVRSQLGGLRRKQSGPSAVYNLRQS